MIEDFLVFLTEDFSDNEEMFAKEITKWSSNDLMDKIETIEVDEAQGTVGDPADVFEQERKKNYLIVRPCWECLQRLQTATIEDRVKMLPPLNEARCNNSLNTERTFTDVSPWKVFHIVALSCKYEK